MGNLSDGLGSPLRTRSGQTAGLVGSPLGFREMLRVLRVRADVAHGYETLMSTLHLLASKRSLKTILVTSTQPGEGKSTVVVNLALTMTLAGEKSLVTDTDWRKPTIHRIFGLENTHGFTDVVTGQAPVQGVASIERVVEFTTEPNGSKYALGVITSGMVARGTVLTIERAKVREAIDSCGSAYDIVLLDSPPVLSLSDASLLAPLVDGVLLVLDTGAVSERDVIRAKERLEMAGGNLLGIVMNRFDDKLHGPSFHPYESSYTKHEP